VKKLHHNDEYAPSGREKKGRPFITFSVGERGYGKREVSFVRCHCLEVIVDHTQGGSEKG